MIFLMSMVEEWLEKQKNYFRRGTHTKGRKFFMALGLLAVLFGVLLALAVILQLLLYKRDDNYIFLLNMVFGIIVSYLAFTGLPTNFTGSRIIALLWGLLAILAMVLRRKETLPITRGKRVINLAIVGGLIQLILF